MAAKFEIFPSLGLDASVANGMFHFNKNESQFLWTVMKEFQETFDSNKWTSGGAEIFTRSLKKACNIMSHEYQDITGNFGKNNII